jgi:hypothetical protein
MIKKPQIPAGQRTVFILSITLAILAILSVILSLKVLKQDGGSSPVSLFDAS